MYKQNFLHRRELSIDLSHRCALECPRCQRQFAFRDQGKRVPGRDITMDEIKKAAKFYNYFNFCGQLSDAVHNPQFIEILEFCRDNKVGVEIHNASSTKSKEWYIKAFKANRFARWVFGIDGLPEQVVRVSSTELVQDCKPYLRSCYLYPIFLILVVRAWNQIFPSQNNSL